MLVVMEEISEGIVIGKIIVVLIHKDSEVYFITNKCKAFPLHDMGVYGLTPCEGCYCCVKQDELIDFYPLQEYAFCGMPIIVPHHSFLSTDNNGDLGGATE